MSPTGRLVLLLLAAQIPASEALTNAGKQFMVIFPENIAYYHPTDPNNTIWITALYDGTQITIQSPSIQMNAQQTRNAGETWSFHVTQELEHVEIPDNQSSTPFSVFSISDKAFNVTSTKDVVVQAISSKERSVQSALVVPTNNTVRKYFIPLPPQIEGMNESANPVLNVTERGPFRLIIVNPGVSSTSVNITGGDKVTQDIDPGKVAQIWVNNVQTPLAVEAVSPVAVFFSHPCAIQQNCTCGLLHAMLPPSRNNTANFPVPPVLAQNASLLLSDGNSRTRQTFDPASPVVRSAGTAILYQPGLLLTLIPDEDFGSCFLVPFIENMNNFFIIVVHKDHKEGIYIGNAALGDSGWQELKGTDYVSTNLSTISQRTFVWHASFKMAVYFVGNMNSTWFGNPAPVVSTTPDFRGCAVTPEVISILDKAESWQNSIQSCTQSGLNLISLPDENLQKRICSRVQSNDTQQVWIGTRRSSMTGDWYWLNYSLFNRTNWAHGEPGGVDDAQCAVMSLTSDGQCGWKDQDCCQATRPLCYKDPTILNK